jgi:hypothetical protein
MSVHEILNHLRSALDFALDYPIPWSEIFGIVVIVLVFWLFVRIIWTAFAAWNWYHLYMLKVGWWMFRHRKVRRTGAPQVSMDLMRGDGTIRGACENDILGCIDGEDFYGVLGPTEDPLSYIEACKYTAHGHQTYALGYQDGSEDRHYQAIDEPIDLDRVLSAFRKYLRGDSSWRTDFKWEKFEL